MRLIGSVLSGDIGTELESFVYDHEILDSMKTFSLNFQLVPQRVRAWLCHLA